MTPRTDDRARLRRRAEIVRDATYPIEPTVRVDPEELLALLDEAEVAAVPTGLAPIEGMRAQLRALVITDNFTVDAVGKMLDAFESISAAQPAPAPEGPTAWPSPDDGTAARELADALDRAGLGPPGLTLVFARGVLSHLRDGAA